MSLHQVGEISLRIFLDVSLLNQLLYFPLKLVVVIGIVSLDPRKLHHLPGSYPINLSLGGRQC